MLPEKYIQNRAALFDWLVLGISFSLGFVFPDLATMIVSPGFFNWILAALFFYIVGAALKDLPLSYRLSHSSKPPRPIPYLLFLVIGHWFIMMCLVLFAEPAIRHLFGFAPIKNDAAQGPIALVSMVTGTFFTWLVYRTKSNRKKKREYTPSFLFGMELVADIFLIAGVSIFSFVFWEKGAMVLLGKASTRTLSDVWFLFVFLCILFVFFYLPLRYLFFMEDREGGANRKRLLVIFIFMLIKASLELLGI